MALLEHPCKIWDTVPSAPPRNALLCSQIWTLDTKHFWIVQGRLWHGFSSRTPSPDCREAEGSLPGTQQDTVAALHLLLTSPTLCHMAPALTPHTFTTTCNRWTVLEAKGCGTKKMHSCSFPSLRAIPKGSKLIVTGCKVR